MGVAARFYVAEAAVRHTGYAVGPNAPEPTHEVILRASTRGDENKSWARYTPNGEIRMTLSPEAGGAFDYFFARLGKDVAITFEDAPDPTT